MDRGREAWVGKFRWVVAAAGLLLGALPAAANSFYTLYSFRGGLDGSRPTAGLTLLADGSLLGVTTGGTETYGSIFSLVPGSAPTLVHNFTGTGDGTLPSSGLFAAANGSWIGATASGGPYGGGTLYSLNAAGQITLIHGFRSGTEGAYPRGVIQTSDGTLFGLATLQGTSGAGVAFRVASDGKYKTIHSFDGTEGATPNAGLMLGSDGRLYGVTRDGGASNSGAIFRMSTNGAITVMHSFIGADGASPCGGVVEASNGILFGTTAEGGEHGHGTIFRITKSGNFRTVYSFLGTSDGSAPMAALTEGTDGTLYGTSSGLGTANHGTIFSLTLAGRFTTLLSLDGSTQGAEPRGPLVQDANGVFYGTTYGGGAHGLGVVFAYSITPPAVTSVTPTAVVAASSVSLTLHATSIDQDAQLFWNKFRLPYTRTYQGVFTAGVGQAFNNDIDSYPGTATLKFVNPDGTSAHIAVTILITPPILNGFSPNTLPHGSGDHVIQVTGRSFAPGATVDWNGTTLPTTFNGAHSLSVTVPAALLANPGIVKVSVTNPEGAGTSKTRNFTIS